MKAFILLTILSISFSMINCGGLSNGAECTADFICKTYWCDYPRGASTGHCAPRPKTWKIRMDAIEENQDNFSGQEMILAFVFGVALGAVFMNLKSRRDSNAKMGQAQVELGDLVSVN